MFYMGNKERCATRGDKRTVQRGTIDSQNKRNDRRRTRRPRDNKDITIKQGKVEYNRVYKDTRYCSVVDKIYSNLHR